MNIFAAKVTETKFVDAKGRESSSYIVKLSPQNSLNLVAKAEQCLYFASPVEVVVGQSFDSEVVLKEFDIEVRPWSNPQGVELKLRWLSPKSI